MKVLLGIVLVFVLLEVALCFVVPSGDDRKEFVKYMKKFNKNYKPFEMPKRFQNFLDSKDNIKRLSAEARKNGLNTKFDLTKFSDLSAEEFQKYFTGYKPHVRTVKKEKTVWENVLQDIPASMDWRTKGAVTDVKDQGQCGSCWAFSATEGVESAWFMAGHQLPVLAPQQIVDCDTTDSGCDGGDLPTAFAYVQSAGQEDENDYPYTAEDGTCNYQSADVVAKITGFQYATQSMNETAMQAASVVNGPLSVCVDASDWSSYSSGIITSCGDSLDHCVQIVGWDTDSGSGTPYWIVRNSWGSDWGLDGYLYVERNADECGIAEEATYVTC